MKWDVFLITAFLCLSWLATTRRKPSTQLSDFSCPFNEYLPNITTSWAVQTWKQTDASKRQELQALCLAVHPGVLHQGSHALPHGLLQLLLPVRMHEVHGHYHLFRTSSQGLGYPEVILGNVIKSGYCNTAHVLWNHVRLLHAVGIRRTRTKDQRIFDEGATEVP